MKDCYEAKRMFEARANARLGVLNSFWNTALMPIYVYMWWKLYNLRAIFDALIKNQRYYPCLCIMKFLLYS